MPSSERVIDGADRRRSSAAAVLGLLVVAVAVTLGAGWAGAGREASGSVVRSGWPLAWATQDQSALSPPGGASSSGPLLSPWEHPTRVDGRSLVADVVVVGGCSLGVAVVGTLVRRRHARRP